MPQPRRPPRQPRPRGDLSYDKPHWYLDSSHLRDRGKHHRLVKIIRDTCEDRLRGTPDAGEDSLVHRSALEHYLTTYSSPELPPSWRMVESLTVG